MQDFVFQIGQENYLRPGNSDIILLAFRSKLMKIPTKDDWSCLVLYIVIYFMVDPIPPNSLLHIVQFMLKFTGTKPKYVDTSNNICKGPDQGISVWFSFLIYQKVHHWISKSRIRSLPVQNRLITGPGDDPLISCTTYVDH